VSGGVIHHTVNANDYTEAAVPAILRSIYAYHTVSRGWSDIGYNFLVDRFGRIWEGRYGGIGRPVIGAHTLDYNGATFGASAIGNFETAQPSAAMVDAYADLFAWKLGLSGVAADQRVSLYGESWPAIVGHGDLGSTACPGRNLYARLGGIRSAAAALQDQDSPPGVARTELDHDLDGDGRPDAVLGVGDTLTVLRGEAAPGFRRATWAEAGHDLDIELTGGVDVTGDGTSTCWSATPPARSPYGLATAVMAWPPRCGRHRDTRTPEPWTPSATSPATGTGTSSSASPTGVCVWATDAATARSCGCAPGRTAPGRPMTR
jgi:hypothetical protein